MRTTGRPGPRCVQVRPAVPAALRCGRRL